VLFYFRYTVLLFIAVFLEATLGQRFAIGGIRPDISLALVVYAGLSGGGARGCVVGFVVGLLRGVAQPMFLGLDALLLGLIGFATATTSPMINRSHPIVQGILIGASLLIYDLIRDLVVAETIPRALLVWVTSAPLSALYTGLLVSTSVAIMPRILMGEKKRGIS
jgi:rod shape-determining protein MreD